MDIHKLTVEEANEINTWTYEEPYHLYSFSGEEEVIEELLDGTYYGCCDDNGEFIGYFCFGENAQVPGGRDAHLYGGEDVNRTWHEAGVNRERARENVFASWDSVCC